MCGTNIYKPELMEVTDIIEETFDTRTFRLKFKNEEMSIMELVALYKRKV